MNNLFISNKTRLCAQCTYNSNACKLVNIDNWLTVLNSHKISLYTFSCSIYLYETLGPCDPLHPYNNIHFFERKSTEKEILFKTEKYI